MNQSLAVLLLFIVHIACAEIHSPFRDETDSDSFRDFVREDTLPSDLEDHEINKRTGSVGYCHASGDPHYVTFDGRRYNFMGTCSYVHVTDYCANGPNKHKGLLFKVVSENVRCGGSVSCINSVDVTIGGEIVHLKRGSASQANMERPEYSVTREGSFVVVRSKPAGLTVKWDRSTRLDIELGARFRGKVCGLCGNFDGNSNNDFTKSNGQHTNNVNTFGQSWKAGGKCGHPIAPHHPCEQKPHRRAVALKDCAVIKSDNFKECRGAVNLDALYRNCVYDVCAETTETMKDSSCEAIKEASLECHEKTGKAVEWGHLQKKCSCQRQAKLISGTIICCHFPFVFCGKTYYDCAKPTANDPVPWCSGKKKANWRNVGECI